MKDTFAPPFSIVRSSPIGRQSAADADVDHPFMLGDRHSRSLRQLERGPGRHGIADAFVLEVR